MKNLATACRLAFAAGSLLLLTGTFSSVQAQDSGGPTPDPTAVPIDGGASLLLAAGVGLGLKKLRDRRRA